MFLDLTVVYFAFGAPVGMYEITRRRRSLRTVAAAAVHGVLWPIFAALSLQRSFANTAGLEPSLEARVDAVRREIEEYCLDGASDIELWELRDVFARYTGLALAFNGSTAATAQNELLSAAGRRNSDTAIACLDRRNHRRLEFHLVAARNDLLGMLADLNVPVEFKLRLASLVHDPDLDEG